MCPYVDDEIIISQVATRWKKLEVVQWIFEDFIHGQNSFDLKGLVALTA